MLVLDHWIHKVRVRKGEMCAKIFKVNLLLTLIKCWACWGFIKVTRWLQLRMRLTFAQEEGERRGEEEARVLFSSPHISSHPVSSAAGGLRRGLCKHL